MLHPETMGDASMTTRGLAVAKRRAVDRAQVPMPDKPWRARGPI
jgi:hypothetical protein